MQEEILEEPKEGSLNIVSLFCGAGGLDLGFEQEGFQPVIAYDNSPSAVATYNYNRGSTIARRADLSKLTGDDIIAAVDALQLTGSLRGIVGGPPCQYFSNGNKSPRTTDDPRRVLPLKYAEVLARLNGKYDLDFFAFENVPGITHRNHRTDFARIRRVFEDAGFYVCFRVLDAIDFGVAQYRKRVILVGWNRNIYPNALEEYHFPEGAPIHLSIDRQIRGLEEPQYWARGLNPDAFPEHPNHWTMNPNSDKFGNPLPSNMRRATRSFRRLSWGRPSYTVAYGHNEIHVHPDGHRRLSIYEAMLLQGFPPEREGYRLFGGLSEQVKLVSDAVPPPLARALASSIRGFIEEYAAN